MKQFYQGDIPILEMKKKEGLKFKKMEENVVVAEGETTGHLHIVKVKDKADVEIAQDENGYYFKVNSGEAVITHPEHPEITFGHGLWFVGRQFEYDELEEKRVLD